MKQISFISGTRADYGKIKPYIAFLLENRSVCVHIFITGMHLLPEYGSTYREIEKDFGKRCHLVYDKAFRAATTVIETAHIMQAYETHLRADQIDFVFIHGDRSDVFGAAIAAAFNNVPICQIEAGDLSGSIDDSLRHAITKLSHRFFVTDAHAKQVLIQLGESAQDIFITGNSSLANQPLTCSLKKYVPFDSYAILIYHPVTTQSVQSIRHEIKQIMRELDKTGLNYLVVLPNNDLNREVILKEYENYFKNKRFYFVPSLPFPVFNKALRKARFLIGNSSCGIKEAPYLGTPSINIGMRQQARFNHLGLNGLYHIDKPKEISKVVSEILSQKIKPIHLGRFKKEFFERLETIFTDEFWTPKIQKQMNLLPEVMEKK